MIQQEIKAMKAMHKKAVLSNQAFRGLSPEDIRLSGLAREKGIHAIPDPEERDAVFLIVKEIRLLHWIVSITIPLPGLPVSR